MVEKLPFWKWKRDTIEREGLYRPRHWYYHAYGSYCKQFITDGDLIRKMKLEKK